MAPTWLSTSPARATSASSGDHIPSVGDQDSLLDEVEEFLTGARPPASPTVLATVLFTDIVGSTERAASWAIGAGATCSRATTRSCAATSSGTGGARSRPWATASSPPSTGLRGIRCATAIREAVGELGVKIRAGLHTGELEVIGGDVGVAVNIGARVGARAGAGEVLVSSTVKDLVVGSGIEFADRGEHELKGVPGAWRLYSVGAAV